jgi:hypothetical protein
MLTTRDQRKRAAAKAIFDKELHARIDRERNTPSDEQRRKDLYAACVAEEKAEIAAQQHAALAPVRELEKTLNADRIEKMRQARADMLSPNYAYFSQICPPFSEYTGKEEDYLDSVRNTFLEFQTRLESTGVNLTQAGLESLAELSDNNTSLNWTDARTFNSVWEHMCGVGFAKEGRDFTVERAKTEPVAAPQPKPDFDTLLATRSADDPELRNAAHEFAIEEARPTFNEWVDSLLISFGYSMPLPVAKQVSDWFIQANLSFLDRSAYDQCRRAFVREGIMPRTCLTPDDLAAEEMESLDIRTPEGRRRAAQLHREGLRRAEQASQSQSFRS